MPVLLRSLDPSAPGPWARLTPPAAGTIAMDHRQERPGTGSRRRCGLAWLLAGLAAAAFPQALAAAAAPAPASGGGNPPPLSWRPGTNLTLTAADHGSTVVLRRGETLRLVLSANAGTGYSWELDRVERRVLEPLGGEIRQAPGLPRDDGTAVPLAGGPQQLTVLFRALAPGRGALSLKLWRPWEGEASAIQRFRVQVVVVGP